MRTDSARLFATDSVNFRRGRCTRIRLRRTRHRLVQTRYGVGKGLKPRFLIPGPRKPDVGAYLIDAAELCRMGLHQN